MIDDDDARDTASKAITLIYLTAPAREVTSLQQVDLFGSGPSGAGFDVFRDDKRVATLQAHAYTDHVLEGLEVFRVCTPAISACSNQVAGSSCRWLLHSLSARNRPRGWRGRHTGWWMVFRGSASKSPSTANFVDRRSRESMSALQGAGEVLRVEP